MYLIIWFDLVFQAGIRVRFPDNHTLEATFQPSDTIQSLIDLLNKVIAQPEKPFYLCKHFDILYNCRLNW
jgi:tether containing UBX domain for GLUT4